MKIAIFSRPGSCFPNIISQGLSGMLSALDVENKIFYDGIPMLMRLLSLKKKPRRWHNNFQFRIRNKLSNYSKDRSLIRELNKYDAVILSECYPNAFWKNYFAIEEFRNLYHGQIISYTESPLDAAPLNKIKLLDKDDYDEDLYDYNLFVTDIMETRVKVTNRQAVIGVNIAQVKELRPFKKEEFIAVVDFAQPGYDMYRKQQIDILKNLGIKTITLEGRYPIAEIREIYKKACVFFLSFPETFGLPISECLACGTYIFAPSSSWPMAWRLDEQPMPMGSGLLPDCFQIYENENDLKNKLTTLQRIYDAEKTPIAVNNIFLEQYAKFYYGDKNALQQILKQLN